MTKSKKDKLTYQVADYRIVFGGVNVSIDSLISKTFVTIQQYLIFSMLN